MSEQAFRAALSLRLTRESVDQPGSLNLVPLRGPVSRAARISTATAPNAPARHPRKSSRPGGVLVVNGHRSASGTRARHITSELHQIWMANDSISDVDREVIGRIARASLRHEEKVPRTVVARSSLRDGGQGNKRDSGCHAEQRILHYHISEALLALPRIYGREGASACSKLLQSFAIAVTHVSRRR